MEFRILGSLEAGVDGEPVSLGTPRQRALLGLLLIHAGEVVAVDRLVEDLWAGDPPGTARHTVQGYVHRLRRALGGDAWRLATTTHGYQLKASADEIDAQRFQDLAEEARRALVRGDSQLGAELLNHALSLWRGPLLADLPDLAAIEPERARLDALRLTALEDQVEAELALGGHAALAGRLEQLVGEHPFRERLHGQLMLALYRSRRQADALLAYDRARRLLGEELGIDPSPWLRRLQQQILVQDPALDAPEPRRALPARHNLPAQRTTFVGRRRELDELQGLLRTRRLVCLTGAAGSGKTRLAVEVAAALVEEFSHGVFFVSLAELEDPELVPAAIATSLGVAPRDQTAMQALTGHLASRRVLLLVDNFEHVIAAATRVGQLLDAAPAVTVLATSRAPLRLSGEQEYPIEALPVPGADELAAGPSGHDALELFADRAAAVDPRFVLDEASAPIVADVAARVDGLPLAIELAAARLRSLPLEELRRQLDPALPLLTRGPVDQSGRHQTLRDAVAWSEDLLAPEDRTLFRRLGAFRGGFTIEAAAAVAADLEGSDVVAAVSALVEASLVLRPMVPDGGRFGMLETTRDYALERLRAAGEDREAAGRHARFFAALVAQAEPELTGAAQAEWLDRLAADQANLRSALRWAADAGEADLAQSMAAGLWRFWQLRGHLAEGRRWLEHVLAGERPSSAARVKALIGLAGICYWQFDLDAAESAYRDARDQARQLGEWWLELQALTGLVVTLACHRGDLEAAAPLEEELQALIAERDDPIAAGFGLATYQMVRLFAGDLESSRAYGEKSLAGCRAFGLRWYELQILRTLALTSLMQGRHQQAEDELRECLEIASELGDQGGTAMDLDRLGQAAVALGRPERGVVLAAAADRLRESVGSGITVESFRWETEPVRKAARRHLSDAEIEVAWARGHVISLEDAVAYARSA